MKIFEAFLQGGTADFPIQCNLRGSGMPAVNEGVAGPNDTFTSSIYQGVTATPLFSPTIAWFTLNGTQTGYEQFQILMSISNDQGALIIAPYTYVFQVWWTPVSTSRLIPIASGKLIAKSPQQV